MVVPQPSVLGRCRSRRAIYLTLHALPPPRHLALAVRKSLEGLCAGFRILWGQACYSLRTRFRIPWNPSCRPICTRAQGGRAECPMGSFPACHCINEQGCQMPNLGDGVESRVAFVIGSSGQLFGIRVPDGSFGCNGYRKRPLHE